MARISVQLAACATALMCCVTFAACGSTESGSDPAAEDGRRVPPLPFAPGGKADSYASTAAKEYVFTGTAHMGAPEGIDTMTPEESKEALDGAADSRLSKVASAIRSHLSELAREMNNEIPTELPPELAETLADQDEETKKHILENWRTQQEVSAASRSSKKHLESIRLEDGGLYAFDFAAELLLSNKLADKAFAESTTFDITVEQYQGEPATETIPVTAAPSTSMDGYPRYNELFADGVLDIAIHVGGDYNKEEVEICCPDESGTPQCRKVECQNSCEPVDDECSQPAPEGCTVEKLGGRVDRWTAEELVTILKDEGFAHEAQTYKDLKIDSPPFVKSYPFDTFQLEVRVKVVFPEIVACGDEQQLVTAMEDSLRSSEVIFYAGHAGPGAGFVLDYQPRTELDDNRWAGLTLPEHYQIVMMYGCETYSTYADALYGNPSKNDANLDVVTTVNTMWTNMGLPGTTTVLFSMLMQEQESNRHIPVSWMALLSWLNLQEQNAHTHYGVHGIDSDPKMSPWVTPADLCGACEADTDCRGGGNFCLTFPDETQGCGAVCTGDVGCGEGYSCVPIPGLEDSVVPKMCVPRDLSCAATR